MLSCYFSFRVSPVKAAWPKSWLFFSWNLKMDNNSVTFLFHGFIAGTILFLLWLVSDTLYLFLNRSDAWNDDVPVLSQALKILELSIVKFAKHLGRWAAALSDLNAREVIIHTKKKRKILLAFKIKSIGILKRKCIFGPLYLSSGFWTFCVNEVKVFPFFRKTRNWLFSSF